jgi:hypothetical protein
MPAHFSPLPLARNLECIMMAGNSSVAAGGIALVSYIFLSRQAVG